MSRGKNVSASPRTRSAALTAVQAREAIPKIERRVAELSSLDVFSLDEETGSAILSGLETKINATLLDVFGEESIEYRDCKIYNLEGVPPFVMGGLDNSIRGNIGTIRKNIASAITMLRALLDILGEKAADGSADAGARVLRAYEGLQLHPEIARVATSRYRAGHYADAVEAAVKALNGLVRLRSGIEFDGSTLMERAFSPSNPALKFNALQDQSDKDEQKGYMMLFSGAVAGLRNPRAHGFIEDDPERALEFIAFVSLLAKLLDQANT
jgi:uncharacterized protein (TIGR02391 family)